MSEQAANAADQMGHQLGAEADNATDEHEARFLRRLSRAFHEFAQRVQGIDPAQAEAERQASQGQGLSVVKEGTPDQGSSPDAATASERLDVVKEDDYGSQRAEPDSAQRAAAVTDGGEVQAAPSQPDPSSPGVP